MAMERIATGKSMDAAVEKAARIMEEGKVVVFPTETVYGIGVISGNSAALAALRRLKNRDSGKPFQYLAADVRMAKALGAVFESKAQKLARNYWPGPLTLVVPDGTGSGGTLGIRIPDSPFVHALCKRLGRAIVSSSANPAGQPPPLDADAADAFGDAVALLVDSGPVVGGVPSTVVRCAIDDYEILREGGLSAEAIDAAWNE